VVVLNETHPRRVLRDYLAYYHRYRTHLSLEKDAPEPRPVPRQNDVGPRDRTRRGTEGIGSITWRRIAGYGGWSLEERTVRVVACGSVGSAGCLRGSTDVSMVEATDFAKRHDPAGLRPFDGPHVGRVLVEREMRACAMIVREIRGQDATQVRRAE